MIFYTEKTYKDSKLIKEGKKQINFDFLNLKYWIEKKYDVKVLNIVYQNVRVIKRPRIEIVFEFDNDFKNFDDGIAFGFNKEKQKEITNEFLKINKNLNFKYETESLFTAFSSFEKVNKEEVISKISEEEYSVLNNLFEENVFWLAQNGFRNIFVFTEEQKNKIDKNIIIKIKEIVFKIIKKYDDFNYFKENDLDIYIDSKENFDKNYESSWFYYYR